MNISNISSSFSGLAQEPGVDEFRRSAQAGAEVHVQVDGESFRLVAMGQTPSGRSVAWVQGSGDATRMFVDALESAFGGRLSQAIATELDLRPAPGAGLPSAKINQALAMAETANGALEGIRFAEQLRPGNPEKA